MKVAAEKFISAISHSGRQMNEYISSMAAAEFKHLVKIAQSGRLKPERQVKAVDVNNPPPLFELRWQGVTVREKDPQGLFRDKRLLVRMYHSEPVETPLHFIGHHIHEKVISGDAETWLLQSEEIFTAVGFYQLGKSTRWGL